MERTSGLPARRRCSRIVRLLVLCALAASCGCSAIKIHEAMEELHSVHYLDLFSSWERENYRGVRDAARGLRDALDDPAIGGYSSDVEYQKYLGKTKSAAEEIVVKADAFQLSGNGPRLRRQLYNSCQACHKAYRL